MLKKRLRFQAHNARNHAVRLQHEGRGLVTTSFIQQVPFYMQKHIFVIYCKNVIKTELSSSDKGTVIVRVQYRIKIS